MDWTKTMLRSTRMWSGVIYAASAYLQTVNDVPRTMGAAFRPVVAREGKLGKSNVHVVPGLQM